jgi:hypothetical protein
MPTSNPPASKILGETLTLLNDLRATHSLRSIADGAGVGYEWLRALVYRGTKSPGVDRIERLNLHLADLAAAERVNGSREQ